MAIASSAPSTAWRVRAARALTVGTVVLSPLEAAALSCLDAGVTAPFRRSTEVPTNTRIWCTTEPDAPPAPIRLRDARGNLVSGTQAELSSPAVNVLVLRPDVDLEPEATYTYECPYRDYIEFSFTTGAGPNLATPPVPDVSRALARAVHREDLGVQYTVSFSEAVAPDEIVVFDVGGEAALDAEGPSGSVSDTLEAVGVGTVFVGRGTCLTNWPDATLGASTTVALGTFDVTGAFSGWSDTVRVTIPGTLEGEPLGGSDGVEGDGDDEGAGNEAPVTGSSASGEWRGAGCALRTAPGSAWEFIVPLAAAASLVATRRQRRC